MGLSEQKCSSIQLFFLAILLGPDKYNTVHTHCFLRKFCLSFLFLSYSQIFRLIFYVSYSKKFYFFPIENLNVCIDVLKFCIIQLNMEDVWKLILGTSNVKRNYDPKD